MIVAAAVVGDDAALRVYVLVGKCVLVWYEIVAVSVVDSTAVV